MNDVMTAEGIGTATAQEGEWSPEFRSAVAGITVSAERNSAAVDGREVTADDPRALEAVLAGALYEAWHAGRPEGAENLPRRLRDAALEQALGEAVPHRHTSVEVVACAAPADAAGDPDHLVVQRDGVRTWVARDTVEAALGEPVGPEGPAAGRRFTLRVPAARPALSPGFFLVDGSVPQSGSGATLRFYVHLTDPHHAVAVWGAVLRHLEERQVPYRVKVLSSPLLYPRRDALVVYLDETVRYAVAGLAEVVAGRPGVGRDTSLFTRRLGPGVAVAWEPEDPRPAMRGLSFGQHRASAVAGAVLHAERTGEPRERALRTRFAEAGADPADPYRNTASPQLF
ncbi:T3SS effector HopA1 family protein [Streptomyces sp. NPDC015131]|uniref:T3SS effector HopA1 family protein n=1 Tax=Streptomyces sp. NPDC015131 TaxID=3364941 RepID=UPI0036FAA5A5